MFRRQIQVPVGVHGLDTDVWGEWAWEADRGQPWFVAVRDRRGMAGHVGVPAGGAEAHAVVVWWGDFVAGVVVSGFVPPWGEGVFVGVGGGWLCGVGGVVSFFSSGAEEVFARCFSRLAVGLWHWHGSRTLWLPVFPRFFPLCASMPQTGASSPLWPPE